MKLGSSHFDALQDKNTYENNALIIDQFIRDLPEFNVFDGQSISLLFSDTVNRIAKIMSAEQILKFSQLYLDYCLSAGNALAKTKDSLTHAPRIFEYIPPENPSHFRMQFGPFFTETPELACTRLVINKLSKIS